MKSERKKGAEGNSKVSDVKNWKDGIAINEMKKTVDGRALGVAAD